MGRHKKRRHSDSSDSEDDDDSSSSASSGSESSENEGGRRRSSSHKKKKHKKEKKKKSKKSRRRSVDERLTSQDYFLKNSELRLWLKERKSLHFEDLTSEQARKYFGEFAKRWNKGKLDEKYYKGLKSGVRDQGDKTRHAWGISGMNSRELGAVVSEVSSMTDDHDGFGPAPPAAAKSAASSSHASAVARDGPASVMNKPKATCTSSSSKALIGPMMPPGFQSQSSDPSEDREQRSKEAAWERKKRAEFQRQAIDDMLPKATGHEAKVEKRKAAAERRRVRGGSPDVDHMRVRPSDDIEKVIAARAKAREHKKEVKQHVASEKLREYQEKERSRMAELMEMAKSNSSRGALYQPKS